MHVLVHVVLQRELCPRFQQTEQPAATSSRSSTGVCPATRHSGSELCSQSSTRQGSSCWQGARGERHSLGDPAALLSAEMHGK